MWIVYGHTAAPTAPSRPRPPIAQSVLSLRMHICIPHKNRTYARIDDGLGEHCAVCRRRPRPSTLEPRCTSHSGRRLVSSSLDMCFRTHWLSTSKCKRGRSLARRSIRFLHVCLHLPPSLRSRPYPRSTLGCSAADAHRRTFIGPPLVLSPSR